ncbi:MAG: FAD synthase [Methanomicrobiales archaeon]|nr:FAD synthase [Methanomicrobiales archaeon]
MKRIVATGTFDILHPGHLYYLDQSRLLGDELHVIVARDVNVRHKPPPIIPEEQRLKMVRGLRPVDQARLGDLTDMFRPIEEIQPAVITLGYNQHFDEVKLAQSLKARGISCEVVRIAQYTGDEYCSSRAIVDQILAQRCRTSNDPSSQRT